AGRAARRAGAVVADSCHVGLRYPRLRAVLHAGALVPANGLRFAVHVTRGSFVKHGVDPQEAALREAGVPGAPDWGRDPQPGVFTPAGTLGVGTTRCDEGAPGVFRDVYRAMRDFHLGPGP